MKKVLLTSVAALTLGTTFGGALAQNSFPDVPADSYATDAVSQLVELGIVNGFPDGTFRGNDAFTRYQAALVVSRLLSVIEENTAAAGALSEEDLATVNNAVAELTNELTTLTDRVSALESAPSGDGEALSALTDRVNALETAPQPELADSFTALEGRVAALEQSPAQQPVPGPDVAALQEQVTALSQQVSDLEAQLGNVAPTTTPEGDTTVPTPEEPTVELDVPVAAPDAVALSGERGKFYVGLGAAYEINAADNLRFRPRVKIGVDDVVAGFGLRVAADYGRQSLIESGSLAASGHLTYTLGTGPVSGYLGVGGGYQFTDLIFVSGAVESPFAGALLGAEFGTGPITFFVEGGADYYFNSIHNNRVNEINYALSLTDRLPARRTEHVRGNVAVTGAEL